MRELELESLLGHAFVYNTITRVPDDLSACILTVSAAVLESRALICIIGEPRSTW